MQLELIRLPDLLGDRHFQLTESDAIKWLKSLPDSSIDCIVTDPAYESLEKHRAKGTTPRLVNWFPIFTNDRYQELFIQFYRVLRNNSHAYIYCDAETMFIIKPIAEACGFTFWKPIVWDKKTIGMGYHYRARYELILFFEKGKRQLRNRGTADILECNRVFRGYPTEKPVEISEILINQSTEEGAIVLDCFAGSGSIGVAALRNGRKFTGCDISPTAIALANTQLLSLETCPKQ